MSAVEQTAEEAFESLTGFDEIAISQKFAGTVSEMAEKQPLMFVRALVFVFKRRDGLSDDEAWTAALNLTMKELGDYFAESSAEESGKDEQPEESPATSLTSVS